jgi:single-stranded DNA-binding protein
MNVKQAVGYVAYGKNHETGRKKTAMDSLYTTADGYKGLRFRLAVKLRQSKKQKEAKEEAATVWYTVFTGQVSLAEHLNEGKLVFVSGEESYDKDGQPTINASAIELLPQARKDEEVGSGQPNFKPEAAKPKAEVAAKAKAAPKVKASAKAEVAADASGAEGLPY